MTRIKDGFKSVLFIRVHLWLKLSFGASRGRTLRGCRPTDRQASALPDGWPTRCVASRSGLADRLRVADFPRAVARFAARQYPHLQAVHSLTPRLTHDHRAIRRVRC